MGFRAADPSADRRDQGADMTAILLAFDLVGV
jgi:hypothetical protein